MLNLFEMQNEVTQDDCDAFTQNLMKGSVTPVLWRGFHSYTLQSNSGLIIQFWLKASPLNSSMIKLVKQVHSHLASATTYHGLMLNSSVSVWVMKIIVGVEYMFTASTITTAKLDITVADFVKWVFVHYVLLNWYNATGSMLHHEKPLNLQPKTNIISTPLNSSSCSAFYLLDSQTSLKTLRRI